LGATSTPRARNAQIQPADFREFRMRPACICGKCGIKRNRRPNILSFIFNASNTVRRDSFALLYRATYGTAASRGTIPQSGVYNSKVFNRGTQRASPRSPRARIAHCARARAREKKIASLFRYAAKETRSLSTRTALYGGISDKPQ